MDRIAISVFDSKFFDYAVRMYMSLMAFNPTLRIFAGDLGLSQMQRNLLEALGVSVLQCDRAMVLKHRGLSLNFSDFLLHSYLEDIHWEQLVWIDADTLVLHEISEIFSYDVDVAAHPGRNSQGPIYKLGERYRFGPSGVFEEWITEYLPCSKDSPYFATGIWCTRSRRFLEFLDSLLDRVPPHIPNDSPIFTAAVHHLELSNHQLDPSIWNFSRELVSQAMFRDGRITYGNRIFPKVVGFSVTDNGMRRTSEGIDRFYDTVVRCTAWKRPSEALIRFVREQGYSKLGPGKLEMLDQLITNVVSKNVPGDLVECGTWRGGSALVIFNAALKSKKKLHLFDTFQGMMAPSKKDYKGDVEYAGTLRDEGGTFGKQSLADTSVDTVLSLFDKMGMDLDRIIINKAVLGDPSWHIGLLNKVLKLWNKLAKRYFQIGDDILSKFPERISFLHVDLDFYQPYRWVLHHLYRRVSAGGVIVFDDYGHWIGAKRAVDEFLLASGECLQDTPGTTQRFIVKRQKVYVGLDDFCEEYMTEELWNILHELRRIYPDFKVTMFTIPGKSSPKWLRWVKREYPWIEMAIHGTYHENPSEWLVSGEALQNVLGKVLRVYNEEIYCKGFKAPWWKLSREAYNELRKNGFWVATNKTNKYPNSTDLLNYTYDAGDEVLPDIHYRHPFFDAWHGHVQSQRGRGALIPNGLEDVSSIIFERWHKEARFGFITEFFEDRK